MVIIIGSWNFYTLCAPLGEETAERQMITDMESTRVLGYISMSWPPTVGTLVCRLLIHKLI